MSLTKDELAALLSGQTTPNVEKEAVEESRVGGEVTYIERDSSGSEEVVEKQPIDMSNVKVPAHLKPTTEHPVYVSSRLVWSRSLAYSRVELEVKVFFPTDIEKVDEALDFATEIADRKVRSYAYGIAEKELESWAEKRNTLHV